MNPATQAPAPLPLTAKARVPRHVVHRAYPAETVVLNLDSGIYHGLNPVAGRMLQALEAQPTIADALRAIQAQFPEAADRVEDDLRTLCGELLSRGLIEIDSPNGRS